MSWSLDATKLMEAYAAMKGIPISKVVRNAARDYVFTAQKTTPTAKESGLKWCTFIHPKTGKLTWVRASEIGLDAMRLRLANFSFTRRYIRKGWSKATWFGAFDVIEIEPRNPRRRVRNAPDMMETEKVDTPDQSFILFEDYIHFDKLPGTIDAINAAGFSRAAYKIVSDYKRELRKAWKGDRDNG